MRDSFGKGMILGLVGYAQTGKDTAAQALSKHGWQRIAFADKLKEIAYDINPDFGHIDLQELVDDGGWDYAKSFSPIALRGEHPIREFLQRLGVAVRDHLGADTWVNAALDGLDQNGKYVITDVRFPNEARAIRARGGRIFRIQRPGVSAANGHASETLLESIYYDKVINNDGSMSDLERTLVANIEENW